MPAFTLATAVLLTGLAAEPGFVPGEGGTWTVSNPAHGFRTAVTSSGFEVDARGTGAEPVLLSFRLRAWGREGATAPAAEGRVTAAGPRAAIERPGLTEWLVNGDRGLEHGFTLLRKPDGTGPVVMEIAIGAGAVPAGDRGVFLRDARGRLAARYDGLLVTDAAGRELPSRLEIGVGTLRIVVDDAGGAWPLTVDPVLSSFSIAGPGQAWASFGNSVSSAGDVNADGYSDVLVAASAYDAGLGDEGAVFLYLGGPAGLGASPAWSAQGTQAGAFFGECARLAGDVNGDGWGDVLVAAPGMDNGQADEGVAYLYLGNGTTLGASPAWSFETNQASAQLSRVSWAGDVNGDGVDDLMVGAPLIDLRGPFNPFDTDNGRAWVFHGTPGGLPVLSRTLSGQSEEHLGADLAPAGDVNADGYDDVIVGSPHYDIQVGDEGRAQVFLGSASGVAASAVWSTNGAVLSGHRGWSVGTAGDVDGDGHSDVVVGEPGAGLLGPGEGLVHVYLGSTGGLLSSPLASLASGQVGARFGESALAAGDVNGDGYGDFLVGAPWWSGAAGAYTGRVHLYLGRAGGTPILAWTLEGEQTVALLGPAAPAGDVNGDGYADVLAGAPGHDGAAADSGKATVAYGAADLPFTLANPIVNGPASLVEFGRSVSSAGDVNGDGLYDVLVGAPDMDVNPHGPGAAYLYLGVAGGGLTLQWSETGGAAGLEHLGRWVSTLGDWNGDGLTDAGVSGFDPATGKGVVRVYRGQASPPYLVHVASFDGGSTAGDFGTSIGAAGDLNGDGYGDFAIGDPQGGTGLGRFDLFYGAPDPAGFARVVYSGSTAGKRFGQSVAGVGDVNADGYDDLAVGAPWEWDDVVNEGRVHLYHGRAEGGLVPAAIYDSDLFNAYLGWSVASAGDVDGDGRADIAAGAPADGRLFLFYGSGAAPTVATHPTRAASAYGFSVSSAGDVNNDGYGDVVVGAPEYDLTLTDQGAVYLHLGSASGLSPTWAWSQMGSLQIDARFGESVSGAFDADGDGFGDVLVGSRYKDGTQSGQLHLFRGNRVIGRARTTRQESWTGHLAIGGLNPDPLSFQPHARLLSAGGREVVDMVSQTSPVGAAGFGGITGAGQGVDTGAFGSSSGSIDVWITDLGLVPERTHRWRWRVLSRNPWFPRSPWFTMPDNTVTLSDLRSGCLPVSWFADADEDAYGGGSPVVSCTPPGQTWTTTPGDCNDADPSVHPGALEVCNGVDDDCNAAIDDVPIGPPPGLGMTKVAATTSVTWDALPGQWVDLVRGGLLALRSTGGDYTSSVLGCLANDHAGTEVVDPVSPAPGDGFFYLGRRASCGGADTYDEPGEPSQAGERDAEIEGAGGTCP